MQHAVGILAISRWSRSAQPDGMAAFHNVVGRQAKVHGTTELVSVDQ